MAEKTAHHSHHHKKVGVSPADEKRIAAAVVDVQKAVSGEQAVTLAPPGKPPEVHPEEMKEITGAPLIPAQIEAQPQSQISETPPIPPGSPPAPPSPTITSPDKPAETPVIKEEEVTQTFQIPAGATVEGAAITLIGHLFKITPDPVTGIPLANSYMREVNETVERYSDLPEQDGQRAA